MTGLVAIGNNVSGAGGRYGFQVSHTINTTHPHTMPV